MSLAGKYAWLAGHDDPSTLTLGRDISLIGQLGSSSDEGDLNQYKHCSQEALA